MNNNYLSDIEFENIEEKYSIKVLEDKNKLFALWLKQDLIYLELNYDKAQKKFICLEGILGEKIQATNLINEDKLDRILESLNNGLWDYFHPPFNNLNKNNINKIK